MAPEKHDADIPPGAIPIFEPFVPEDAPTRLLVLQAVNLFMSIALTALVVMGGVSMVVAIRS